MRPSAGNPAAGHFLGAANFSLMRFRNSGKNIRFSFGGVRGSRPPAGGKVSQAPPTETKVMRVRVFFHDRCFDGAAAAAVFSRFYSSKIRPDADFVYTGLVHRASQLFDEAQFDGDENAIVDFKYCSSPRVTWWFDHHQSAFLTPDDARHFQLDRSGKKFYDPDYRSCTKFVAAIARARFGFEAPELAELVEWADIIDGAQYPNAATAVRMEAPATQLTLVIEMGPDHDLLPRVIGMMASLSLADIMKAPEVAALFKPLYERHLQSIDLIRECSRCDGGVVFFDVTSLDLEGYSKFIPYYLFPESVYSVSVSPSSFRTKISVGSNPWNTQPRMHNLATICERYGGGGHARVGAISFETGALERARQVAGEIVEELQKPA
jgi:hypothetical protein